MNEQQKKYLRSKTCYILDVNIDLIDDLKSHGIPSELIEKIDHALDLIFEVNQETLK
jgi:hypothetical protein